ncbi:hypothetical protein X743_25885 [Mesorhizobium sp. LNHC252B00]|nr:hypothetical protein X743_25885 [Mesorhizobium sp. LNHC252B00]
MARGYRPSAVWHEVCVAFAQTLPILAAPASQSMIPESGSRFPEKIMFK